MSDSTEHSSGLFDLAGEVGSKKIETFKFTLNQGIAVAVILVFLWFVYVGCSWLGREIFVPARDRMFLHLDKIESTLTSQEKTMQSVKDCIKSSVEAENRTAEALETVQDEETTQTGILKEIRDQRRPPLSAGAAAVMAPGNE